MKLILNQLKYSFHVIFHPFDGFWDIKHENRGSTAAANIIVLALILTFMIEAQFTGYIFTPEEHTSKNIIVQFSSVLLPLILWCTSNWSITTLMDGEGRFKDIYITTAYSLTPLIIINLPLVICSRFFSSDEVIFYQILSVIAVIWFVFLLFCGIMTIHQFTVSKTIVTCIIAIVGMGIIIFLCIVFLTISQQLIDLIQDIYKEWILRS